MRVIKEVSFCHLRATLDSSSQEAQATKQSRFACRVGGMDGLDRRRRVHLGQIALRFGFFRYVEACIAQARHHIP
jgi:hypothetical protein